MFDLSTIIDILVRLGKTFPSLLTAVSNNQTKTRGSVIAFNDKLLQSDLNKYNNLIKYITRMAPLK